MKVDIKVPPIGESVSQATVSRIIQPSGSLVTRDQEVIELETDKVNQVLYAPQAGKLELTVAVGQAVTVGQVIGSVDTSVQVAAPAVPVKPIPAAPITAGGPSARIQPGETILRSEKPASTPQKPPS